MSLSKLRPKYMHSQNIFFGAQELVTIDHAVYFPYGELTQSKLLRATASPCHKRKLAGPVAFAFLSDIV